MRLSTKTRHGIRALFDMAFHCRGRQAQAKEIAERQAIPIRYLEEVMQELRRAGLVEAHRGPRGGYVLARPPEAITAADIVRALEGPIERLFAFDEIRESREAAERGAREERGDGDGRSARVARAPVRPVDPGAAAPDVPALIWNELAVRVAGVVRETTLQDFVARAESAGVKRATSQPTMYFI
jgi:Rrf2 family protein